MSSALAAQNAVVARQVGKAQRAQRARAGVTVRAQAKEENTVSWSSASRAALVAGASALAISLNASPVFAKESYGVYFVEPANNSTCTSPCTFKFGVKGLDVKPAAEGLVEGTGHHHVIVDGPTPKAKEVIPFDDTHLHYGKGQTEASIALTPGKHTLTLQFANAKHESYGPGYAKTINVTVQ